MEVMGSLYTGTSEKFFRALYPIARCVKAEMHDLGVVMTEVKVIGSLESKFESTNRVYDSGGVSPTLSTMQGGNQEPKIMVRMCGRNPDRPTDRTPGLPTEQRIEPNAQGISGCLTSVQKDNMVLENLCVNDRGFLEKEPQISDGTAPTLRAETHGNLPKVVQKARGFNEGGSHELCPPISASSWQENNFLHNRYRIRKLTPRECGRLMDVSDEDITKMQDVNSNSQLYKQFGNSIVVAVMVEIFKNLNICQDGKDWAET